MNMPHMYVLLLLACGMLFFFFLFLCGIEHSFPTLGFFLGLWKNYRILQSIVCSKCLSNYEKQHDLWDFNQWLEHANTSHVI
jgi:hypothetical protein